MLASAQSVDAVIEKLRERREASVNRLCDWLRMASVGTDPAFDPETRKAAEWCRDQLAAAGFKAELRETGSKDDPGNPIVWATNEGSPDYKGPHVLFYGHYDVQPADPIDLWESGPFEPVIKPAVPNGPGERVVARGACDDKGQVATFLEAMRAWKDAAGGVPVKFTVLIEGEEESGSVNLEKFLEDNLADIKKCDVVLISDTGMPSVEQPAITYGMRGLAYTEVILHGPDQDLHSGLWGGRAPNPLNELTKILGRMWDENRKVTIPGFYDRVQELTSEEREQWKRLGFDPAKALKKIGLAPQADIGEQGYTSIEREWARPTAEINGVTGGYQGAGAKTVIPSKASAKVSFRLVADQREKEIRDSFFKWLEGQTPPGCRWEFKDHGGGPPATVATDSPFLQAARRALKSAAKADPVLIKSGGSIPVVGLFRQKASLESILMGFGLEDDRVHSPNEKFELACFHLGTESHARLVGEFASMD